MIKWKNWFGGFGQKLSYDLILWIAGYLLASGIVSAVLNTVIYYLNWQNNVWFYFVIFIVIMFLFLFLYPRFSKFRPVYPKLPCKFTADRIIKQMIIPETGRMQYRTSFNLISRVRHLEKIQQKFFWTGNFKDIQKDIFLEKDENSDHYELLIEEEKSSIWSVYTIIIKKNIKKGDKINFTIVFNLNDVDEEYKPFMGASIEFPVKELIMQLIVPTSKKLFLKWRVTFNHIVDKEIDSGDDFAKERDAFNNNTYAKTFPNPKLLHNYKIFVSGK